MERVIEGLKSFDREMRNMFYEILISGNLEFTEEEYDSIILVLQGRMLNACFDNTSEYIKMNETCIAIRERMSNNECAE